MNGTPRKFASVGSVVRYEGRIPAKGALQLTYRPRVRVDASAGDVAEFPFVVDGKPAASVVLPLTPTDHDRYLAEHVSIYFDYWTRRQSMPSSACSGLSHVPEGPTLPIVEADDKPLTENRIVFASQPGGPVVSLSAAGRTLTMAGPRSADREAAMRRLLAILDRRYPFYGALSASPLHERVGLTGRPLE